MTRYQITVGNWPFFRTLGCDPIVHMSMWVQSEKKISVMASYDEDRQYLLADYLDFKDVIHTEHYKYDSVLIFIRVDAYGRRVALSIGPRKE